MCIEEPENGLYHKLLESFYQEKKFRTYDLFQNWERFFNIEVKAQNAQGMQYLKFAKATGFTMIKNWVTMAKENNWLHEAVGIEEPFLMPYNNSRFSINMKGFMDLLIEVHSTLYVLDWKSGKHDIEKYKKQAIIYSWATYKKFNRIEKCVRFVHPSKKENRIVDVYVTDDDYYLIKNDVELMFDAIESDNFEKHRDEKSCKWCNWVDCEYNTNSLLKTMIESKSSL